MSSAFGKITCFWSLVGEKLISTDHSKKSNVACYPEKLIFLMPWPYSISYKKPRKIDTFCLFFTYFIVTLKVYWIHLVDFVLIQKLFRISVWSRIFFLKWNIQIIIPYYISFESRTSHSHIYVVFKCLNCNPVWLAFIILVSPPPPRLLYSSSNCESFSEHNRIQTR